MNVRGYFFVCRAAGVALAVASLSPRAAAQTDHCAEGKAHWQASRYSAAKASLMLCTPSDADVDFKLGTASCRIRGGREFGGNTLAFVKKRYELSDADQKTVEDELRVCRGQDAMPVLVAMQTIRPVTAGSAAVGSSHGKHFRLTSQDKPLAVYTARRLGEPDVAALRARITKLGADDEQRAKLEPLAPEGARIVIKGRFAFVTSAGQTDRQLAAISEHLETFVRFLERNFKLTLPDSYLTLCLTKDVHELRRAAAALHKLEVSPATIGYSYQDDLSAVVVSTGKKTGTLKHEIFHLLVRLSFAAAPQWLDEGIAALYEQSVRRSDEIRARPNWRGDLLAENWHERPTLAEVINAPWYVSALPRGGGEDFQAPQGSQSAAVQLAAARYFALWLQERDRLFEVFDAVRGLRPGDAADPAAAERAAAEMALGRSLDEAQPDFDRWFKARHRPRAPRALSQRQR